MKIENLSQIQLTSLIKGFVQNHESNKELNPMYSDPEMKEFVSKYNSNIKVESVSTNYKAGLMITETDCGVYGLYHTTQWNGEERVGTQPVVKFNVIDKLYDKAVMKDFYNYLKRI